MITTDELSKEPLTINSMQWVFSFLKDKSIFDVDMIEKRLQVLIDQAELGKLILDESPCHWDYQYNDGDCYYDSCKFNEVCKLRNEILKGGKL